MNFKAYKPSLWAILRYIISGSLGIVIGGGLIFYLCLPQVNAGVALGVILSLVAVFIILSIKPKLEVQISSETLQIIKGKAAHAFKLKDCQFSAKLDDNANYDLIVFSGDATKTFDLSLLGYRQFNEVLQELGVIGEKAKATKLITKK